MAQPQCNRKYGHTTPSGALACPYHGPIMRSAGGLKPPSATVLSALPPAGQERMALRDSGLDPEVVRLLFERLDLDAEASDIVDFAAHPNSPPELLAEILSTTDKPSVRRAAASNPALPTEVALEVFEDDAETPGVKLAALLRSDVETDERLFGFIASAPSRDALADIFRARGFREDVAHAVLDHCEKNWSTYGRVAESICGAKGAPQSALARLLSVARDKSDSRNDADLRGALIAREDISNDVVISIIQADDGRLSPIAQRTLLDRRGLPGDLLISLARSNNSLWAHPDIPSHELVKKASRLLDDPEEWRAERPTVLTNPSLPPELLARAVERLTRTRSRWRRNTEDGTSLAAAVAKNSSTPPESLGRLYEKILRFEVRELVVANKSAPEQLLRDAAASSDYGLSSAAIENPRTPDDAIAALANNLTQDDPFVVPFKVRDAVDERVARRFGVDKHNVAAIEALRQGEWWTKDPSSPEVRLVLATHRNP